MSGKFLSGIVFCCLSSIASVSSVYSTEIPTADITRGMVESVIRPAINEFSQSADTLQQVMSHECASNKSRSAFRETVKVFSAIEFIRIGVMNQDNRAERLFFWPDRKGIGQRQLRKLLGDTARKSMSVKELQGKSVAIQGLSTLEAILFDNSPANSQKCSLATTVSANIAQIAHELVEDWNTDSGVAAALLGPSTDDSYRTETESLSALLTLADAGLQTISDRKIHFLIRGIESGGSIPKNAPFVKSELTLSNIKLNLDSVYSLFKASGFENHVSDFSQFQFEYKTTTTMIDVATEEIENYGDFQVVVDRLKAAQSIIQNMNRLLQESFAPEFGLKTGFNASDGD